MQATSKTAEMTSPKCNLTDVTQNKYLHVHVFTGAFSPVSCYLAFSEEKKEFSMYHQGSCAFCPVTKERRIYQGTTKSM